MSCKTPSLLSDMHGVRVGIGAQIVQALQLVLEELLLHDLHLHPFQVVGYEGVIGAPLPTPPSPCRPPLRRSPALTSSITPSQSSTVSSLSDSHSPPPFQA